VSGEGPVQVLVVHVWLHRREVEHLEIYETIAGLVRAAEAEGSTVCATDGRVLYGTRWDEDGQLVYVPCGGVLAALRRRWDVAHIHMILPHVHLLLAVALRLRGTRVVLTPMSMLGNDFASGSWFRTRAPAFRRFKPYGVRVLRVAWRAVTTAYVVQSREEALQARLPVGRCSFVPLPAPRTALADALVDDVSAGLPGGADGPLAFVSRLDSWRKGIDRICGWLDACADVLPRPAVVLYAADEGQPRPSRLGPLHDEGLLHWDQDSRGAALVAELLRSRAVVLLSRWDGQPRVLREAALLGLPTISTRSSHFEEVVRALGSGVIVDDADDPAQVQAAFEAVATQRRDPAAARKLFARESVGRSVLLALRAVAQGRPESTVDHYTATRWTEVPG
jgi:glycosyltransferase involved in cell wall biosynthesis